MSRLKPFAAGSYRYIPGVFQYSAGVQADDGFEIVRARFKTPVPLADGFSAAQAHLASVNRSTDAFCSCELRSPAPFSEQGFVDFNKQYVDRLQRWGLVREQDNPVARTNVCPEVAPPEVVSIYAFSYTRPKTSDHAGGFVVAGSGEALEGKANYRDFAIRLGDRSPAGLAEKGRWVLSEMERRMEAFGAGWRETTGAHLYTVYDVHPFMQSEIVRRGAAASGLSWHFARPPVQDLDYEMDVRSVFHELVL